MNLNNRIIAIIDAYDQNDYDAVNGRMDAIVFEYLWSDVESYFSNYDVDISSILTVLKDDVANRYWCYIYYFAPKNSMTLLDNLKSDTIEHLNILRSMNALPALKDILQEWSIILPEIRQKMDAFLSFHAHCDFSERELFL